MVQTVYGTARRVKNKNTHTHTHAAVFGLPGQGSRTGCL